MNRLKRLLHVLPLLCPLLAAAGVSLEVEGLESRFDNGHLRVVFGPDASARSVTLDGQPLIADYSGAMADSARKRSGYLDYHSGRATPFHPARLMLIERTPQFAHVAYLPDAGEPLQLEYHLTMRDGLNALQSWVIARNAGSAPLRVSELRSVWRFDASLLDRAFNGERDMQPPLYASLERMPKLQDETWTLPDGSVYSKYDLAGYPRRAPFWGVHGHGYGAWLLSPGRDYYSGDDLKQDLLVHQDAIVLNYLTGAHFGTPDLVAPPGWEKFYGPWLMYFNQGDAESMKADAARQAREAAREWPDARVRDARYPLQRASLSGHLVLPAGPARRYTLQLWSEATATPEDQTLGYFYATQADTAGRFRFEGVRPGHYRLAVRSDEGAPVLTAATRELDLAAGEQTLSAIALQPAGTLLWAIGDADRRASGFRFADQPRANHWHREVPADLDFVVGRSNPSTDWYFAQTRPGRWNIRFDTADAPCPCRLDIDLAAASHSGMNQPSSPVLAVELDGQTLALIRHDNDKSIYRHAMTGGHGYHHRFEIPADRLGAGAHSLSLVLKGGAVMYDSLSLSRSPAADTPLAP
ncbi:polysaccharide lyase family protein [Uliginosibacterium paludis]|uniref:rhamnogalacturonan endolyase n=1 Tax=Uliginosibacterium paludis TaxID=1615952 RepID=A0ABV2CTA0_9RHOO